MSEQDTAAVSSNADSQAGLFKAFAVRDGRLVTGQQQYSGREVARIVLDMPGI